MIRRISVERARALQQALLPWFRANRRDLPWRRTRDPYAVWLSEVMLQQTRVDSVVPYWERFLSRFPDVRSLAAAPLDDVLALWSGLGYYARARNLHRAAQVVAGAHGGRFPDSLDALRALPGFGPYTAAAVGSIALGLDAALVDGNVARVVCRWEGWQATAEQARDGAWETVPALLPNGEAGDWNQALMELGAVVCTPRAPRCEACPTRALCAAARTDDPARHPLPKARRERPVVTLAALVIRAEAGVLLVRRAEAGLFGGLWEPPCEVVEDDPRASAHRAARRLFTAGARTEASRVVAQTLTHREVVVHVFQACGRGLRAPEGSRQVPPSELPAVGLSSLAVKVLAAGGVDVPNGHGRRRETRQTRLF